MSDTTVHITAFLQLPSVAVVGISGSKQTVANAVVKKLRNGSRTVYGVGRSTPHFEGQPCYPSLASLPVSVQGVFAAVRPENIAAVADECIAAGVRYLWLHNMGGTTLPSSSPLIPMIERCRAAGMTVIPGACPMMFVPDADLGHRCIKWFLSVSGGLR
jgi:predicted CoA-binding protein